MTCPKIKVHILARTGRRKDGVSIGMRKCEGTDRVGPRVANEAIIVTSPIEPRPSCWVMRFHTSALTA